MTAAFSFAGTELVGLAASEHPNPRKALPAAIKMTFWRITIMFVLSLTMVGFLGRLLPPWAIPCPTPFKVKRY